MMTFFNLDLCILQHLGNIFQQRIHLTQLFQFIQNILHQCANSYVVAIMQQLQTKLTVVKQRFAIC